MGGEPQSPCHTQSHERRLFGEGMAIDIASDYKALSTVDHWLNSWDRPGNAYWGLGEDGNSIYESIK